jgi:hypothetical protein
MMPPEILLRIIEKGYRWQNRHDQLTDVIDGKTFSFKPRSGNDQNCFLFTRKYFNEIFFLILPMDNFVQRLKSHSSPIKKREKPKDPRDSFGLQKSESSQLIAYLVIRRFSIG